MYERSGLIIQQKFKEYLIPTVLTSMAISMASVVDGIIVGLLLGDMALAAVGLASPVVFSINLIYLLFAVGGLTCASIAQGKRDSALADTCFTISIGGGLACMFLFLAVMQAVLHPVSLSLAGGDINTATMVEEYMRPLLFTGPALMFSSGLAVFIRTDGNPRASAAIVIIANAVNLILDYVLIRFLDAGIWGAGASTALGYIAGSVIVIPYLLNKKRSFHFVFRIKNGFRELKEILMTGLPKASAQICNTVRSLAINTIIMLSLGSTGMSIMTVCTNVLMISNTFVAGISDALLPIVGTLYGERDYFGMKHAMRTAKKVLSVCCAALVVFFMAAPQLMGIAFGIREPEAMEMLDTALRLFVIYLPFSAFLQLHQNFYNTTGRRSMATKLVVLDGLIFVVPFAVLFTVIDAELIWLCFGASGVCAAAVLVLMCRRIRRKENVEGLLLIKEEKDCPYRFDFSIKAAREEAVKLSEHVMSFKDKGVENVRLLGRIAVVLEEMTVASVHYAHKDEPGMIDILVFADDSKVTIQMRDNGSPFNPLEYIPEENDGCVTDSIELVKRLASKMEYGRQLGFNTCVITFEFEKEQEA